MNILTPNGYKDITDCQQTIKDADGNIVMQGDDNSYFDLFTGEKLSNYIVSWEAVTKSAWESLKVFDRTRYIFDYTETVWDDELEDYVTTDIFRSEDIYKPETFDWYLINNTWKRFKNESVWISRNNTFFVIHIKDLQVGDIIFDDTDNDITVTSVELIEGTDADIFYRLEISGDHSYIADGLTYHNASKYWNGTGNWSGGTAVWFTDDTHTTGTVTPTSTDDALFTSSSTGTCTMSGAGYSKNINFTGFTGTFTGSGNIYPYGDVTLGTGMTYSHSAVLGFLASATNVLTSNTIAISSRIRVDAGTTLVLADDLTLSHSSPIWGIGGTLNCNSKSITLNNSNISLYGFTCQTLIITTPASLTGSLSLKNDNLKITNSFVCNGNSETNRYLIQSDVVGTTRTITLDGSATATITLTDFTDITGAGSNGNTWFASNTLVGCGDACGNSGLVFPEPVTRYWRGITDTIWSSNSWAELSGGAEGASVPLCHDTIIIDDNSSASLTINISRVGEIRNENTGGRSVSTNNNFNFYKSIYCHASSGGFSGNGQNMYYTGRGDSTLDFNNKKTINHLQINSYGGSLTLSSDVQVLYSTSIWQTVVLTSGTLKLNGHTLKCGIINLGDNLTRTLDLDTGVLQINHTVAASRIVSTAITNLTIARTTGYIKIYATAAYVCTLQLRAANYGKIVLAGTTEYTTTISTVGETAAWEVEAAAGVGRTINFVAGGAHTITDFKVSGQESHLAVIKTNSAGSKATLIFTKDESVDYVNIRDMTVSDPYKLYCGTHSTDSTGNNANVIFTAPPGEVGNATNSGFFMILMGM